MLFCRSGRARQMLNRSRHIFSFFFFIFTRRENFNSKKIKYLWSCFFLFQQMNHMIDLSLWRCLSYNDKERNLSNVVTPVLFLSFPLFFFYFRAMLWCGSFKIAQFFLSRPKKNFKSFMQLLRKICRIGCVICICCLFVYYKSPCHS